VENITGVAEKYGVSARVIGRVEEAGKKELIIDLKGSEIRF
jgi:hypothetical protein